MDICFFNRLDITPDSRGHFVSLHNVHPDVVTRYFRKWRDAYAITDDNYRYACDLKDDENKITETFFVDEAGYRAIELLPEATSMFRIREVVRLDLSPARLFWPKPMGWTKIAIILYFPREPESMYCTAPIPVDPNKNEKR